MLQRTGAGELVLQELGLHPDTVPALCTTERLGEVSPPMNRETPTTPSLPTTANSAD
jgi:hypothetical protein